MEQPNYIYKTNEIMRVPRDSTIFDAVKMMCLVAAVMILIHEISDRCGLYAVPKAVRIAAVVLFAVLIFIPEKVKVASPLEIRLYDDHLVVFRDRSRRDDPLRRREYYSVRYEDVSSVSLKGRKLSITGSGEKTVCVYRGDNPEPEGPVHQEVSGDIVSFCTDRSSAEELMSVLEKYCPTCLA